MYVVKKRGRDKKWKERCKDVVKKRGREKRWEVAIQGMCRSGLHLPTSICNDHKSIHCEVT